MIEHDETESYEESIPEGCAVHQLEKRQDELLKELDNLDRQVVELIEEVTLRLHGDQVEPAEQKAA